jgi:hypothetical protein
MLRGHLCLWLLLAGIILAGCAPQVREADREPANLERGEAGVVALPPAATPPAATESQGAEAPATIRDTATESTASAPAPQNEPAATGEYAAFALPVGLYYETEDKIAAVLDEVAGGLSPADAAPRLVALAAEFRPRIRPYWLWVATATNDQKNDMLQNRGQMLRARHSGPPPTQPQELIELARLPGNEAFKAALAAVFQAQVDEAPRLHAANAQKQLDQLKQ